MALGVSVVHFLAVISRHLGERYNGFIFGVIGSLFLFQAVRML